MKIGVITVIVVFLLIVAWVADIALESPQKNTLSVTFVQVSSSTIQYIVAPSGTTALMGGGSDASVLRTLSSLMPWYQRTIDIVVATNSFIGITDVLARYHARYIFIPPTDGYNDTWYALKRALVAARRSGSLIIHAPPGQTIDLGGYVIVLQ